jgi:hypothetical protein
MLNRCQQIEFQLQIIKRLKSFSQWFFMCCWIGILFTNAAVAQMQPLPSTGPIANPFNATVSENSTNNLLLSQTSGSPLSVNVTVPPSHGVVVISGLNFIYTPTANYSGSDSFAYTASNTAGVSAQALVSLTITPNPPTANSVSVNLAANSVSNIIPANITGTATSISLVSTPAHGSVSISGLNMIYTPFAGYIGPDSFTYKASNVAGNSAPANVSISVNGTAPTVNIVNASVAQNSSSNVISPNIIGSATSVAINSPPAHGNASVSGMTLIYTPNTNYFGSDTFSYIATNGSGSSSPANVNITVNQVAPIANTVNSNVLQNSSNNTIASNTTGTVTSIALTSLPANGSANVSGLNIIYTPTPGFVGTDNFKYIASNSVGSSANASIFIVVSGIPPVANPIRASVLQNSSNNIISSSIIGTAGNITINSLPGHGSASVSGLNIIYTPAAGYVGNDQFSYTATNAYGTSASATVDIIVNGIPPTANSVSSVVNANSTNNAIASSVTGNATSIALASAPLHGIASVSGLTILYTPTIGYSGTDTLTYTATNAYGTSAAATINITVNGIAPSADPITSEVFINSSNNMIATATSGNTSSISLATTPSFGVASINGLSISYTPNAGFIGNDSFNYIAHNAFGTSSPARVTVVIKDTVPVANSVNANVLMNSTNNTLLPTISSNTTSLILTSSPSHGTATISGLQIIYTPNSGYTGTDSFNYRAVNASGSSSPATVSIQVTGIAPIANAISTTVLAYSSNNAIASNITGNVTGMTIASSPLHGTASVSGLTILYTPTNGYTGTDTFTYTATNAFGTSPAATITINVNGIAPNANPISGEVLVNSSNNFIASTTSGGATSLSLASTPAFGIASVNGLSIAYTPNPNFVGTDNFSYVAHNAFGASSPASVTVQVKDTIPVASNVSASVVMNSSANTILPNVSSNTSSLILDSSPSHGTASISGLQIIYTPSSNFTGNDSFQYHAVNASGISSVAKVSIQVTRNIPIANPINATVLANSSSNAIASQTSGAVSSIAILGLPQHGVAQINGSTILYTPNSGYVGTDTFTYIASNSFGNSAAASVNINVTAIDSLTAPTASNLNISVNSGSSNNSVSALTSGLVNNISIVQMPTKGVASVSGLSMLYTPNLGFTGTDSYTYIASSSAGNSAPATVTITVADTTPIANSFNTSVQINSSNNVLTPNILGNANSISLTSSAAHGLTSINGLSIIYTPTANFTGTDSFTYVATNANGTSAPATVTVTVNGVTPIARAISLTVEANSSNNPISSSITGTATSIAIGSATSHGSVSISGLLMSYTPQANFSGTDSFTYIAKNSFGDSTPALVTIQVKPIATTPLAIANAVSIEVTTNSMTNLIAANVSGSYTQLSLNKTPAHGTVSINGNQFSYTPTKDYSGSDSFSYQAINASGSSNEALVSINVKQTPPVTNPTSTVVEADQSNVLVRPNTSGTVERISVTTPAAHGTTTVTGIDILYTPATNFVGTDSFTYTASNAAGISSPTTVTVIVKAKPPSLANGNIQLLAGTSASLDLATLVNQTLGANASFSIVTQAAHATATISGSKLNVSAHLNYAGSDQLRILASVNGLTSNTSVITLTITGRPDPARDLTVQALQATKAAVITQFERLQLENFNSRLNEIASQNSGLRNKEDKKKNEDACSKVALWAGGLNSFSSVAAEYEIKQHNGGASFGGDRCIGSPDTFIGFGVGYANSRGELRGQNATMNAQARNIANYGQFSPLPFFNFSWVVGVNDISSDYTRTTQQLSSASGMASPPMYGIAAAPANTTQHTGKWSGKQKMGSTSVGFDVDFTDFKISPYLRLDRSVITIGAYTETGDERSALHYQQQSFNSQRTTLGINTETLIKTRFGELTPRLRFEYQKDVGKRDDIKINFVDNPDSTPYIINGNKLDRRLFHMGIGGDLLLENGWVIILNYGYYRSNEGNSSNALRIRLSYRL